MDLPLTPSSSEPSVAHAPEAPTDVNRGAQARRWLLPACAVLAVGMLGGAAVYFREPVLAVFSAPELKVAAAAAEPVTVVAPGLIAIGDTPLKKRLQIVPVQRAQIAYPHLNVTGYVMARLASGKDQAPSRWDFASTEVAAAYGDWLNASEDVIAKNKQAKKTRQLEELQVAALKEEFERKEKGVGLGAVPPRELAMARADYLKADLQAQRNIFEAETELKKAERNRGLLERQLLQAGVDPEVVRKATDGLVLVVADVPEAKVNLVRAGQPCEASFFGVPDQVFQGTVGRIGPSLSRDKRTLRVTFDLANPPAFLLPGMFADIGLGTESRSVLTVPTAAVLHANKGDYVLKEEGAGAFRIVEVKADEPRPGSGSQTITPVAEGPLHPDDHVIGAGAILLKPILVKALTAANGVGP